MAARDAMNVDERRKYIHKMRIRYWKYKSKRKRGRILDEIMRVTGLHRKSIIRLINGELERKPRRKQRGKEYGAKTAKVVRKIAHSLDYPCAERLQPNLLWMAEHLKKHGELELREEERTKLKRISVSTLRRMLPPSHKAAERMAHRKGVRRTTYAQREGIPMRRIPWQEKEPGHFETDLVHHSGPFASGQYIHTLQITDVATGWSECVAILGRSYLAMQDGFQRIEERLPFDLQEIHPDNGSEFLNAHMLRYWKQQARVPYLSRSHPYEKNDNRYVEEDNFSQVRAYVGYERLDTVAQSRLLNLLYNKLWLYHNFFQPVMRLAEKSFIHGRIQRRYDLAKTPFDRLSRCQVLSPKVKQDLLDLRERTNPLQLRYIIHDLIDQLHALPCAVDGVTENVHLTILKRKEIAAFG